MPVERFAFLRLFVSLVAACAVALAAVPARADGEHVVVSKDRNTEVRVGSRATVEVRPGVRINSPQDGIRGIGRGTVIDIGRGARVHGATDGIDVDHARKITVRGRVSGGDAGIEVDGFGDLITHILITGSGVVRGRNDGIDFDNDALGWVVNFGLIEGHRENTADGIADLRGRLDNYGRILANDEGVETDGDTWVFNRGLIWGGRTSSSGNAIDMESDGRLLWVYNSPYGEVRATFDEAIEIGGNERSASFMLENWGLVHSETDHAIDKDSDRVPASIYNYGILRGGFDQGMKQAAIEAGGGVVRLRGTGLYDGGVRKEENSNDFLRVVLDGVNVPLSVKQKWDGRVVGLGEGRSIDVGPRLRITGADEVRFEDLYSFQEFAEWGLMDAADSLDNAVVPRLGVDLEFLGLLGMQRDDPRALNTTLETFTGRAVHHALSDVAFTTETLIANKINDYMDRRIDRGFWDAERAIEHKSRLGGFVQGVGTFGEQDPTDGRVHQDWVNYGGLAGLDYQINERAVAGALASFRTTEADVDGFGSWFDSDDVSVGGYGSVGPCGCGFVGTAGAWYTYHHYDGARVLGLHTPEWFEDGGYFNSSSQWKTNGHQLTTFARASYAWRPTFDPKSVVMPFFTTQYSRLSVDGYEESGSPNLNLEVDQQVANSLRTMLGVRLSREFDLGNLLVRPEFRGEWIYENMDDGRNIQTNVQSPYIRPFNVDSDVDDRSYGKIGVGVAGSLPGCDCMELSLNYDTILGREGFDLHDVSANLMWRF